MSLFDASTFTLAGEPTGKLSAGQRQTQRARIAIANGKHPANGLPVDATHRCADCANLIRLAGARRSYLKCPFHRLGWSRSAASDMRASWPACPKFEEAT